MPNAKKNPHPHALAQSRRLTNTQPGATHTERAARTLACVSRAACAPACTGCGKQNSQSI